jgi:hypothetical protein
MHLVQVQASSGVWKECETTMARNHFWMRIDEPNVVSGRTSLIQVLLLLHSQFVQATIQPYSDNVGELSPSPHSAVWKKIFLNKSETLASMHVLPVLFDTDYRPISMYIK